MARKNVRGSSKRSSVSSERQRPSVATRTASASRSSSTTYARAAVRRSSGSTEKVTARHVTRSSSERSTRQRRGRSWQNSTRTNSTASTRRAASMTKNVSASPEYVGNIAFPSERRSRVKNLRNVTKVCHSAGQTPQKFSAPKRKAPATATEARAFSIIPESRLEVVACSAAGTLGALLGLGFAALLSLLKLGGVW